ncbi:MAG TPA: dihydropteroate synthase [Hellea balneolensis]|uniref:Dihydropteroate synthase n=1 Tax=Hellea balneolensis TaxID=287478 RepID=A0A7V5U1L4_9PROT|nr:dihydropteroate synthase [Hellea balneolensis]
MRLRPQLMGILNVTPDSFSDGGENVALDTALARAEALVREGANIIDIGGESTRPGARPVSLQEEMDRVLPVIEALAGCEAELSVDTRKPEVARTAVKAGAHIWNDVTALGYDESSPGLAAELGCKVVLMHMQGQPETMQDEPEYDDVVGDIRSYLEGRIEVALKAGVAKHNIIVDPGIGFGKRLKDNLDVLARLDAFHSLGCPILLGTSRKSFIGRIDGSDVKERLGGSIASALWGASLGASIIRVHDVKQTVQALKVWQAIRERDNG